MGIVLSSQFDVQTALPLDSRLKVADATARDALAALVRYEGMIVYVVADQTNYQLVGGITNSDWVELAGSGSGGGTSLNWYDGTIPPLRQVLSNGLEVHDFSNLDEQERWVKITVPASYEVGDPIKLEGGKLFAALTTGNVLIRAETRIFRGNISAVSNPNAHTSTNTQVAVDATANELVSIGDIDLTEADGEIDAVAVQPLDLLLVKIWRDVSAETSGLAGDARIPFETFVPKFTA